MAQASRLRASERQVERIDLQKKIETRPVRSLPLTTQHHVDRLRAMKVDFPHFSEVIDSLSSDLVLQMLCGASLHLAPTLMHGAPGLGKTFFATKLAEALGFHFEMRTMADMTAGFVLSGGSSSWSEAQPGLISRMLIRMEDGKAPLLLLDELDKAGGDSRYSPERALLGLIEQGTAQRFRDENLDVDLDIRPISFLFTANDVRRIRPELVSRLHLAEVSKPTQEQMPAIIRSVDEGLRAEYPGLAKAFAPLDVSVVQGLSATEPRALRRILRDGYARVADREGVQAECLRLKVDDVLERSSRTYQLQSPLRAFRLSDLPMYLVDENTSEIVH